MKFFPIALGKKKETRKFYETYMPVCSSLYEPNQKFLELYHSLNIAYLKNITEIETISLKLITILYASPDLHTYLWQA